MEKIIIFHDNDEGDIERVLKVKNWNSDFDAVVKKAREAWMKSTDELYEGFMLPMLKEAGYEVEEPEFDEHWV